ncbi:MAG: GAF domain-containing sensor histidine kinase [Cytophagales bacterium]|nr:GAF domain-containing sensor histidine kinase [Armatimonadota bacterium]
MGQKSLRAVIESISGEMELRPLLARIVRHACELIGADNGTIGLVDSERDLVRTEAVYRMPPDEIGAEMPRGIGLAGQVLVAGHPLVFRRYGRVSFPTQLGLLENAVVGLPIHWRGQVIGVFGIGSEPKNGSPPTPFTRRDIETLTLFARHAAIAIENARLLDTTQQTLRDTRLLYETSARLSAALTDEEIIAAYLDQVAVGGRYACTVALYERDHPHSIPSGVSVRGAWNPQTGLQLHRESYPYTQDALDSPLDKGETVTIRDVHSDPRTSDTLRAIQRASGRPALAMIPLLVYGERIGLVILSSPRRQDWHEDELRRFQTTAAHLTTALDRRRQQLLVQERGKQVAVLEERQRFARELHDSVTQLLFSTTLVAHSIAPAWQRGDHAEAERRLARVLGLTDTALAEMRALLGDLRSEESVSSPRAEVTSAALSGTERLRRQGLGAALQASIGDLAAPDREGPIVTLEADRYPEGILPLEKEEALLRIASEAVANALRHAHARRIQVRLTSEGPLVHLIVEDDGVGFVAAKRASDAADGSGMGLRTMRMRAAEAGAEFEIESVPGTGVRVSVILSLPEPGRSEDGP